MLKCIFGLNSFDFFSRFVGMFVMFRFCPIKLGLLSL